MSFLLALAACLSGYLQTLFQTGRPHLLCHHSNLALVDNTHLQPELDIHHHHKFVLFTFDMTIVFDK